MTMLGLIANCGCAPRNGLTSMWTSGMYASVSAYLCVPTRMTQLLRGYASWPNLDTRTHASAATHEAEAWSTVAS